MKKFLVALSVVLFPGFVYAPKAAAQDTTCIGVVTGVHQNVVVPEGQHCTLQNAVVTGNVAVRRDASLQANASFIAGNVGGSEVRFILMQFETQVGGNVDINGGAPGTTSGWDIFVQIGGNARVLNNQGFTFIDASTIDGNLSVLRNTGDLEVEFNTVGGNVDIVENTVPAFASILGNIIGASGAGGSLRVFNTRGPGHKQVVSNTAGRVIACRDNDQPFVGGPNVAPKKEGQCF